MGFWSGTKKAVGHVFDFRIDRWMDLDSIKQTTGYYLQQTKELFRVQKAKHNETFEEALDRLSITPDELAQQSKRYLFLAIFFSCMSLGLILYGILTLMLDNLMGTSMCFALSLYGFSLAFRYHFWHFQMKNKKLGCSIPEWSDSLAPVKMLKRKKS